MSKASMESAPLTQPHHSKQEHGQEQRQEDRLDPIPLLNLKTCSWEATWRLKEVPVHLSSGELSKLNYPPPIGEVPLSFFL